MNALDGTRVVSVGHTLPGLACVAVLRDLGADVLLVERRRGSSGADRYAPLAGLFPTESLSTGTSRLELDLKAERGRALFLRIAERADVILDGLRPRTMDRLGIGFSVVQERNSGLVWAAISGFGQDGPAWDRPAHDLGYLAATGLADLTGRPGEAPSFAGVAVADGLAAMSAALNIVSALHLRNRTGQGAFLDVAIIDGPAFLLSSEYEAHWRGAAPRSRGDTHLSGKYPWYAIHVTRDDRYVSVSAVEPQFYAALCSAIGHRELAGCQFVEGEELARQWATYRSAFRSKTLAEWQSALEGIEACVEPVLSIDEAADAPHLERVRRFVPGRSQPMVHSPVRLPLAASSDRPAPLDILLDFGLSVDEIEAFVAEGVIDP